MNKAFLGVDPGKSGAIAVIYETNAVQIFPMPIAGKEIDVGGIIGYLKIIKINNCVAYIEKVSSRPGQGVVSVFKFGFVTGILHGVFRALEIPLYTVTPQAWKKEIHTNHTLPWHSTNFFNASNIPIFYIIAYWNKV